MKKIGVLLVILAALIPRIIMGQEKSKSIKVLSYNIHYGIGMDAIKDLDRIAALINKVKPDLVGLQEVTDSTMTAELSAKTDMVGVFGASMENKIPNLYGLLGIEIPKAQLYYGDAILSNHPIKNFRNESIPSATSSRYEAMCVEVDLSRIFGVESMVKFVNTHFDWKGTIGSKISRNAAVEVIEMAFFDEHDGVPSILTGDLNTIPDSEPIDLLRKNGWVYENLNQNLFTVPVKMPKKQIDYVLVRPKERWRITEVEVLDETLASDHLPVLMTLELLP